LPSRDTLGREGERIQILKSSVDPCPSHLGVLNPSLLTQFGWLGVEIAKGRRRGEWGWRRERRGAGQRGRKMKKKSNHSKRVYIPLRPEMSGLGPESLGNPECPGDDPEFPLP
jgi:hypothetical protein